MAEKTLMGRKELLRSKVLEMVKREKMTLKQAAGQLKLCYRQTLRVYRAYLEGGDAALIHGLKGKPSGRRTAEADRERAAELYRGRYGDFGPTFAAEKMAENEGIEMGVSTLRRILIGEGLWERKRSSREYRSRRERRSRFGELVQFDGSPHDWFEGRAPRCCLITLIDDATNTRMSQFFEEETTAGAFVTLKRWIERYGIPQNLYCDHKNAFVLTREPTDAELLKGVTKPKSHFGKACGKLGIEVIPAGSAQAKGRVERNHGIDQDRLVKELRLAGISSIEEANRFLLETYLPKMNSKFSRLAASKEDAHVPLLEVNLLDIFCFEYERVVSNDYVVRFETRLFQILKENRAWPRPKKQVLVHKKLDGSIVILWNNKPLKIKEIVPKKEGVQPTSRAA
jgi:hypothetical protein